MELTELLKNYDTEIGLLPFSENTIYSYKNSLKKFLNENNRVYRMNEMDLKNYFSDFRKKYSDSYYNIICSSVKILYEKVLKQPRKMDWFKPIHINKNFVDIITFDEFVEMMKSTTNLKHKTEIIILFSTGIRIGEMLSIKISDVNLIDKRIFIETEKRGKNRYVPIHYLTLKYINKYLLEYKPKEYLFEGQNGGKYSATSVRNVLKNCSKNLNKNIYPHKFRHSFISKVIENENVFKTMEIAGHKNLKSTLHYYHISNNQLNKLYNPLDN